MTGSLLLDLGILFVLFLAIHFFYDKPYV